MDTNKKLNKKQVANILAVVPGGTSYTGRKFSLAVQNTYTLNNGDFAWDGGSKTEVFFVKRLTDGRFEVINAEDVMADPIRDGGQTTIFTISADAVVVERCFFCGKDMGFTFYVSCHDQGNKTGLFFDEARKQLASEVKRVSSLSDDGTQFSIDLRR